MKILYRPDWLVRRGDRFGCRICSLVGAATAAVSQHVEESSASTRNAPFAQFEIHDLKTSNIRRHERSVLHRQNAKIARVDASDDAVDDPDANCPTIEHIVQFWEQRKHGASLSISIKDFTIGDSVGRNKTENSNGALRKRDVCCSGRFCRPLAARH